MAEFNEMSNAPIEIEIAGKRLKARRPDLNAIFGELESRIISKAIDVIKQAAVTFDLEGPDKMKFLRDSMQDIPQGLALQVQVQDMLSTVEGTTQLFRNVLKKDQPDITDMEILDLVLADPDGGASWMAYLTGDSKKAPKIKAK